MRKQTRANRNMHALLWTLLCLGPCLPGVAAQEDHKESTQGSRGRIAIIDDISLMYSSRWVDSGANFTNAHELLVPAAQPGMPPLARTFITYERRSTHAEAVERLAAIANNVKSAKVTYLQIAGWPAMQRRYSAPLPHREEEGQEGKDDRPALWTTTAVAVGSTLVRIDTTVFPGADPGLADDADAAVRQLAAPAALKPSDTEHEVIQLQRREIRLPPRRKAPAPSQTPQTEPLAQENEKSERDAAAVNSGLGELEIAVSSSGQNVVVASNNGVAVSSDAGATFPIFLPLSGFLPFGDQGDPSATVGASGKIYVSYLGLPNGKPPVATLNGCSVTVMSSHNGGTSWKMAGNPAFCRLTSNNLCSTDQEHIAADRMNAAPNGDQIYVVWRHFTGGAPNCIQLATGSTASAISCSTNSGASWSGRISAGSGDHPRVTVGPDGFVYVTQMDGDDVVVSKFTSCRSGLTPVNNFPVTVLSTDTPSCPYPGLDRCDVMSIQSPTLAVDDTDPSHLYVSYVQNASGSNDDIVVADSSNGGRTWSDGITVSSHQAGHRFFPWMCSMGGTAFVSYYDRAAATSAHNDLTNFFRSSAFLQQGTLTAGTPHNLSRNPDPECASPWPRGFDNSDDWTSCSVIPKAGRCASPLQTGSKTPCNLNAPVCSVPGEFCQALVTGAPKYGDYNGIGCGGSHVVSAWASATAPPGLPATGGQIQIFDDSIFLPTQLTATLRLWPPGDPGRFNLLINGVVKISDTSGDSLKSTVAPGTFNLKITAHPPTSMGAYTIAFSGDCDFNGKVKVFTATSKSCTAFVENKSFSSCTSACETAQSSCMADAHSSGQRQACIEELNICKSECGNKK